MTDTYRDVVSLVGLFISIAQLIPVLWPLPFLKRFFTPTADGTHLRIPGGPYWAVLFAGLVLLNWWYEPLSAYLRGQYADLSAHPDKLVLPVTLLIATLLYVRFEDRLKEWVGQVRSHVVDALSALMRRAARLKGSPELEKRREAVPDILVDPQKYFDHIYKEGARREAKFVAKYKVSSSEYLETHYERAMTHLDRGRWWRAYREFRKVSKVSPEHRSTHAYLNRTSFFLRLRLVAVGMLALLFYAVARLLGGLG